MSFGVFYKNSALAAFFSSFFTRHTAFAFNCVSNRIQLDEIVLLFSKRQETKGIKSEAMCDVQAATIKYILNT